MAIFVQIHKTIRINVQGKDRIKVVKDAIQNGKYLPHQLDVSFGKERKAEHLLILMYFMMNLQKYLYKIIRKK